MSQVPQDVFLSKSAPLPPRTLPKRATFALPSYGGSGTSWVRVEVGVVGSKKPNMNFRSPDEAASISLEKTLDDPDGLPAPRSKG